MTHRSRPLTHAEMEVLEFERGTWKYAGAKDAEIRERFGWSAWQYTQTLLRIVAMPAAEAYDAPLVHRIRRKLDARRAYRTQPTT